MPITIWRTPLPALRLRAGVRPTLGGIFAGLRRQAGADETVLISAEPFCRHVYPPVELSENEYPPGLRDETFQERRRAYIARVREAVGSDDCEVVVVLRRQDRCAESMFKERIKGTGYSGTFNAFREAFSHRFRYFDQVSAWAAFFSKLHVLVYEDLAAQGDLVAGFFGALGVTVPADLAPALQTNISLNNDLIEYKRRLNGSGLDADRHYAVAEAMGADEFNNDSGARSEAQPSGKRLSSRQRFWPASKTRTLMCSSASRS